MTRLLVVDDDVIVRTVLAHRLRMAGYLVESARDGRAALTLARRWAPEVLLTDWMMPEMDGPELVQAMRGEPALADTYIILLTSREHGAADVDDYLNKPWSDAALLACVAKATQGRFAAAADPVDHG